jgi:hypothetical protein
MTGREEAAVRITILQHDRAGAHGYDARWSRISPAEVLGRLMDVPLDQRPSTGHRTPFSKFTWTLARVVRYVAGLLL